MNIPAIDSIGKLLVFLGIAIIVISSFFTYQRYQFLEEKGVTVMNAQIPYITELKSSTEKISSFNVELSKIDSQRNKAFSELNLDQTHFKTLYPKYKQLSLKWDSVYNLYNRIITDSTLITKLNIEYEQKNKEYDIIYSNFKNEKSTALIFILSGFMLIFLGIIIWYEKESFEKSILLRQNLDKPTFSKCCQSCGKSFSSLIKYGTENNGLINYNFCLPCFQNGKFVEQELTFSEMSRKIKNELTANSISGHRQKKILNKLGKLDRWKKDHYGL